MFYLYTPWKPQKTFGFLTFSGVQKQNTGLKWVKQPGTCILYQEASNKSDEAVNRIEEKDNESKLSKNYVNCKKQRNYAVKMRWKNKAVCFKQIQCLR